MPAREGQAWVSLERRIVACRRCPRLRSFCAEVARRKRKAFREETYWGRPVPNFGRSPARLLVVGLAPAAHGANRTGRMFTGDRSGQWLYRALHRAGFASQAESVDRGDGQRLIDCAITAVCHCAPPENRPRPEEIAACEPWLSATWSLSEPRAVVGLGHIAWRAALAEARRRNLAPRRAARFAHGAEQPLADGGLLLGSYHPSQQNTFTGRLTEAMLDAVFARAREWLAR